jgi:cytochrome c-type biogenesis protein CcmH/NrfF
MRLSKSIAILVAAFLSITVASTGADAQASAAEKTAGDAISQLRSPYCPGLMLEVCPSQPAEMLRDSIRGMAVAGMASDEIVENVLARHGEEWRAIPKRSGAGLWAWLAPPFALLLGTVVIALWLRSRPKMPDLVPVGHVAITDDDRARLDAAMAELERAEARS